MADKKESTTSTKKRGRPVKTEAPLTNEEKEVVTMTQKSSSPSYQEIKEGVGKVVSVQDTITIDAIQNRWKNIFSKYSNLGIDTIVSTIGSGNEGMNALNNPFIQNRRVKQISTAPVKLDKDGLNKIISDPENCEQQLRSVSNWLSYTNYMYQTLIQLNRDTAKYCYYANPLYLENFSDTKLKNDSIRVDKILKKFNVNSTFKDIAAQVYTEGKCTYLVRTSYDNKDINYLLLQKLNSDNVKITGFGSKQKFITSFNMIIFLQPGYSTEQYPKFIQDTWREMIDTGIIIDDKKGKKRLNPKANLPSGHMIETLVNGSYMYWVQLPQDLAVTFYSNGAHPNAFPDTLGLFNDLIALDDWKWYQGQIASQAVNAVMTAEVPYIKDPKPGGDSTAASPDTILGFTDMWNQIVGGNVSFFAAPFTDFKLHSIETNPDSLNVVYDRIKDLVAASGNSALLPINDKPSIASVQTARMIQEAKADYLTRQFEQFLNNVINDNFDLSYQWHITIHAGIFNWREDAKMVKEVVLQGNKNLLPRLLSYYDMSIEDCKGTEVYLNTLGIKLLSEEQAEMQAKNDQKLIKEESKSVGRPALGEDQIQNDNTAASRDAGTNDSELKKYSLERN